EHAVSFVASLKPAKMSDGETAFTTDSIPTSFSQLAMSASVSWRTCRVVVHSSILARRPPFERTPSGPLVQPAWSRIWFALAGSYVAGGSSAKNHALGLMAELAT